VKTIVNSVAKNYPELARSTERFTVSTRGRLTRALVHALRGCRHDSRTSLHDAVGDASHELQAAGLNDHAVLNYWDALVENTARACGANRRSLMSGELRWEPVRARVLEFASIALRRQTAGTAGK
jgi:hypothetical protein